MSLRIRVSLRLTSEEDSSIIIQVTGDDADVAATAIASAIADAWRTEAHHADPGSFEPNLN